jgi:hypothetical protein
MPGSTKEVVATPRHLGSSLGVAFDAVVAVAAVHNFDARVERMPLVGARTSARTATSTAADPATPAPVAAVVRTAAVHLLTAIRSYRERTHS